ncbi:hypothetical protein [uncultured Gammaproteobacteria bacterium]|jgi:hypothetical protein|nr:hypothetical protein [uncultured Gammaproteobacteria bacterium]CAC9487786.1 hypothetical protein [uncultured Gammaproteobacteria bacterium]CAC9644211.1 hypothetical protein [uncultured Gammaproteobacteria bacterium]CAC9645399.1 hypothetical protein [uncultured Gammaproteobacteria bacterium]VVH51733.1 hypothetical protein BPUTSESOX_988 [uncultured Gammaproteobacteria bacterium]
MSRSVEIIYKPYYRKFLSIFTKTLPKSYEKYTEITQTACDDTSYLEMERDFVKCVEFYSEEIFIATSSKINTYLNDFLVMPKGSIDEFKIIFFLAQRLSFFLKRDGLETASKIVLSTMIGLLDERLKTVNAKRPVLTKQTIKMIHSNTLFEKTGEVGLYLTYKCLYKHAEKNQNIS